MTLINVFVTNFSQKDVLLSCSYDINGNYWCYCIEYWYIYDLFIWDEYVEYGVNDHGDENNHQDGNQDYNECKKYVGDDVAITMEVLENSKKTKKCKRNWMRADL